MNKHTLLTHTFFVLILAMFIQINGYAEPANLSHLRQEVIAYHDSGDYQHEIARVLTQARRYIMLRVAENAARKHPQKLAIVLDIDETSLSNYDYMVKRDFVGSSEQLHQEKLAANAPVIKPMLALYQEAKAHGVAIFFVTGRHESERDATIKNLKLAGYSDWAHLYLRPEQYNQASILPFKSQTRAAIKKQGYTIIESIGDQYSDLNGGYTEKKVKLPNPYYYLP